MIEVCSNEETLDIPDRLITFFVNGTQMNVRKDATLYVTFIIVL